MGPLAGIKMIELAGLGPAPFAGMLLADMGAEVILVERQAQDFTVPDCNRRGKKSIVLNLKDPEDIETLLRLIEQADVLYEGFRPGVMERLGIGPDICLERNPRLIYARMTGWGQTGPLAASAGHDINYISLTGALHAMGKEDQPPFPPLNLVGDYGGGGMFLVTGILAAYIEAQKSGKGQVIDVAMTDGSAVLMSVFNTLDGIGGWTTKRMSNLLDGGTHYYNCYETRDGKFISIGAIEPQFYDLLLDKMGVNKDRYLDQNNQKKWEEFKKDFVYIFKTKTRDQWCEIMEGTDICFAPVLDYKEAQEHPHNVERGTYIDLDGIKQPAPAPRFSRTPSTIQHGSKKAGEDQEHVLRSWLS